MSRKYVQTRSKIYKIEDNIEESEHMEIEIDIKANKPSKKKEKSTTPKRNSSSRKSTMKTEPIFDPDSQKPFVQRQSPKQSVEKQSPNTLFPIKYYAATNFMKLGQVNSIIMSSKGKLYDTLVKPDYSQKSHKPVSCLCLNSKCRARYCDCFAKGKPCSEECGCRNCQNTGSGSRMLIEIKLTGCKCSKSHCTKLYCDCRKEGNTCTSKCKCVDCKNIPKDRS